VRNMEGTNAIKGSNGLTKYAQNTQCLFLLPSRNDVTKVYNLTYTHICILYNMCMYVGVYTSEHECKRGDFLCNIPCHTCAPLSVFKASANTVAEALSKLFPLKHTRVNIFDLSLGFNNVRTNSYISMCI